MKLQEFINEFDNNPAFRRRLVAVLVVSSAAGLLLRRAVRLHLYERKLKSILRARIPSRGSYQCEYCGTWFDEFDYLMDDVKDVWCGQCERW